jgi:hypothetical protein
VSFPRFRRASSELHSCLALLGQFSCTVTRSGAPATYAWGSHHVRALSRYKSGSWCYHHSSSNGRVPPPHPHSTFHSSAESSWDLCCLTHNLCLTMYKLSLILFALFSLVLPILAAPVPASDESNESSATLTGAGRVCVHSLFPTHDADILACRVPGLHLAWVVVVDTIPRGTLSSRFPRISTTNIAERCVVLGVKIYLS